MKDDETLAYYCAGTILKKWTPAGGITTLASGFIDLANLVVDPKGQLVVTDRGSNLVYRVAASGTRTIIAGNGTISGGGDGFSALQTGLYGVRGVWFLPTGGYLLATHEGSQVWYVDAAGLIHLFVNGRANFHFGDGSFFFTAGLSISEPRSVTLDYDGNLLITENDYGYVRKIRFLRLTP